MEPADDMSRFLQTGDPNKGLRQSVEMHQPTGNESLQRTSPNIARFVWLFCSSYELWLFKFLYFQDFFYVLSIDTCMLKQLE